jgi:hypothetical protein
MSHSHAHGVFHVILADYNRVSRALGDAQHDNSCLHTENSKISAASVSCYAQVARSILGQRGCDAGTWLEFC